MKKNLLLIIGFVGLSILLASCEKEGVKAVMLDDVNPPVLGTMPNLNLNRANANELVTFTGTPVITGFQVSANYFLEVDVDGNEFANPLVLFSGRKGDTIRILTATLNGRLLEKFEADVESNANFRLRSVLNVDAGQGAPGSGANPMVYTSATVTAVVNPYGLPRLNLVGSGMEQMIQSAAGDGVYEGLVKLDPENPFTLVNPDDETVYGGILETGPGEDQLEITGNLQENGPAIVPFNIPGWCKLTVNTNTNTYIISAYRMGIVGSATPNGWNGPDINMEYNLETKQWERIVDLVEGEFKFRTNNKWDFNFGFVEGNPPTGPLPWFNVPLQRDGMDNNFPISQAGNYTITLKIAADEESAITTIIKN